VLRLAGDSTHDMLTAVLITMGVLLLNLVNISLLLNWTKTELAYTVELGWLELEGTVKMCSSYQSSSHRSSVSSERKNNPVQTRTVSLRYDKLMHSTVKIFNPLESYQRLRLLNTYLLS